MCYILNCHKDKKALSFERAFLGILYENYFFGFPLGVFFLDLGPTLDIAHLNPM
jgi:hypothetical protein